MSLEPPAFTAPSLTIAGEAAPTTASFDVINPATGRPFLTAPDASLAQLDLAVEAAAAAFDLWRRSDDETRQVALRRAADVLVAAADEIAPLLTAEQGKPLTRSHYEVHGSAAWLRYYADLELPREVVQDDETGLAEVVRRPFGPVAAIAPWNFPLTLAAAKIGPALRAGNTVVLKPSPYTPLTSLRIGELLRGVFPPGVLNVLSGGDELGAAMTSHPLIRRLHGFYRHREEDRRCGGRRSQAPDARARRQRSGHRAR
jgi:acyl-CoA reductase-like NAD-dependent aldehyde dehydrogenase